MDCRVFLAFFDLLAKEILRVVEEDKVLGRIFGALNVTFLDLIPKKLNPTSFNDFRPFSFYNLMYKLISQILVKRLKGVLSNHLSEEHFGFLYNRKFLDGIRSNQEFLHSLKLKQVSVMVMKLDLEKDYDKVIWTFLQLVLLKIFLHMNIMNW